MAEIVRYVDTDVVGGAGNGTSWANAHPTLADWESDNQADLDTANNWMHAYVRGDANDGKVSISGWTTSAADYILIEGTTDSTGRPTGVWNTGKYTIVNTETDQDRGIYVNENYVRVDGVQVSVPCTAGTGKSLYGILSYVGAGSSDVRISNCILKGAITQAGNYPYGINNNDCTVIIWNTIIHEFNNEGTAITQYGTGSITAYSCAFANGSYGTWHNAGSMTFYNSVFLNLTDDFSGAQTASTVCDYCASDDANSGTFTNGVDFTSEATDWAAIFTDYANGDFRLKNYTGARCLINAGSSKSYGDPDIQKRERVAPWDIGPFESRYHARAVAGALGWGAGSAKRKFTGKRKQIGVL